MLSESRMRHMAREAEINALMGRRDAHGNLLNVLKCTCGEIYLEGSPEHRAHMSPNILLPPNLRELGNDYGLRVDFRHARAAAALQQVYRENGIRAAQRRGQGVWRGRGGRGGPVPRGRPVPRSGPLIPRSHQMIPVDHQIVPGSHQVVPGGHQVVPGGHQVVPGSQRMRGVRGASRAGGWHPGGRGGLSVPSVGYVADMRAVNALQSMRVSDVDEESRAAMQEIMRACSR
ncbi:uncharacterized protein F5Z01DRAFT_662338 [Emericellopsis atlantica]|uniref:Uncharacterized protein n=1 Tax=Emericellopsis atlantica TaxID=2614577 RepID=A0A9P8CLP8_9HYPO|nr:uncharacterized protein F5Z01DRAFT_662338 [Emericellopsis atlantica]KAG9251879.1 hypothetical protein F5Z01DRAFT_662338 [Emericellopsis atlantica]